MNELERYKHNPPFDVSDEDIERLVNECTERAIERNHRQRIARTPVMRWIAVAAMVVLIAGAAWILVNRHLTNTFIQSNNRVLAENKVASESNDTSSFDVITAENIRQRVNEQPQQMPLATAHHQPSSDNEVAVNENMDEIDLVLNQMTESELNMLDEGYYIDEIPEY